MDFKLITASSNKISKGGCCRMSGGGCCKMSKDACCNQGKNKLNVFDWLDDLPETRKDTDFVEIQFKNTRKQYCLNSTKINLKKGDMVAVEATSGHDIGEVTLIGRLVLNQIRKNNIDIAKYEKRRIYRIATPNDLTKYESAKKKEHPTMIQARQIAERLNLNMKIGDVEYQGDGSKAIFYYIANERVDFRQLIRVLAETFRVRIEMKQIGARQEAGRIGGIGPCGRELCCAKWMSSFSSVSTSAARIQDLSLNPQKLAGQCGKLKCCMNYELETYVDASKGIPSKAIELHTKDATYYHFKTDVFKREMQYSSSPDLVANLVTISIDRVKQVIAMNKRGKKPINISDTSDTNDKKLEYENVVGQDSLTRFDNNKHKTKGQNNNNNNNNRNSSNRRNTHT